MRFSNEGRIAIYSLVALALWIFVALPLFYFPWKVDGNTFLGLSSTVWTAIGALSNTLYCILTAGLVAFAAIQISAARKEAKINRTLAACEKYDLDPILDRVCVRLSNAHKIGAVAWKPDDYASDLSSIFNYFELIAIGVRRDLYDAEIVRDQLEWIIQEYVDDFVKTGIMKNIGFSVGEDGERHYQDIILLSKKWLATPKPVG